MLAHAPTVPQPPELVQLEALPLDLSGWLAAVALAKLARRSRVWVGYQHADGIAVPVASHLDQLADRVSAYLARLRRDLAMGRIPEDLPVAGAHLRFYGGSQTVASILRKALERMPAIGPGALTADDGHVDGCPSFGWTADAGRPSGYRGPGQPMLAGRPLVEVLAWTGLGALRWDPWAGPDRFGPSRYRWPQDPPAPARRWLRRQVSRAPNALRARWQCRAQRLTSNGYYRIVSPAEPMARWWLR